MNGRIIYSEMTSFGELQILDTVLHGQPVRYLLVDGWQESAMYLNPGLSDRLIFPYMKNLAWPLSLRPHTRSVLLLGGGAFTWPRHLLSHYPGISITAVEQYSEIIRAAREFFGLDQLETHYTGRLSVLRGNGFELLRHAGHSRTYDLIVNDAFTGRKRAGRTLEDTILAHDRLSPDGIYAVNVTSAVKGPGSLHLNLFLATLGRVFLNTDLMICEPDRSPYESQNILVIASDSTLQDPL